MSGGLEQRVLRIVQRAGFPRPSVVIAAMPDVDPAEAGRTIGNLLDRGVLRFSAGAILHVAVETEPVEPTEPHPERMN